MSNGCLRQKAGMCCDASEYQRCQGWSTIGEETMVCVSAVNYAIIIDFHRLKQWTAEGKQSRKKVESLCPITDNMDAIPLFYMGDHELANKYNILQCIKPAVYLRLQTPRDIPSPFQNNEDLSSVLFSTIVVGCLSQHAASALKFEILESQIDPSEGQVTEEHTWFRRWLHSEKTKQG